MFISSWPSKTLSSYHHRGSEFDSGYGQRSQQRSIREVGLNAFRIQFLAQAVTVTRVCLFQYQLILSVARSCYWDLLYLYANDSDVINLPVGISRAIMIATISYREASKHRRAQSLYVRASNFHPGIVHTFLTLGPVVFVMAWTPHGPIMAQYIENTHIDTESTVERSS